MLASISWNCFRMASWNRLNGPARYACNTAFPHPSQPLTGMTKCHTMSGYGGVVVGSTRSMPCEVHQNRSATYRSFDASANAPPGCVVVHQSAGNFLADRANSWSIILPIKFGHLFVGSSLRQKRAKMNRPEPIARMPYPDVPLTAGSIDLVIRLQRSTFLTGVSHCVPVRIVVLFCKFSNA